MKERSRVVDSVSNLARAPATSIKFPQTRARHRENETTPVITLKTFFYHKLVVITLILPGWDLLLLDLAIPNRLRIDFPSILDFPRSPSRLRTFSRVICFLWHVFGKSCTIFVSPIYRFPCFDVFIWFLKSFEIYLNDQILWNLIFFSRVNAQCFWSLYERMYLL